MILLIFIIGAAFGLFSVFCIEKVFKVKPKARIRMSLYVIVALFGAIGAVVVYLDYQRGAGSMQKWIEEKQIYPTDTGQPKHGG